MGEWKEYKLEEMTEPIKDTYNPDGTDEYRYIGLEHIEQETLRLNSVGVSSDVTSNKFIFRANDVLFGKLRPYFRKVVKPNFDGICSTDIWVLRAKKGFDQDYLYYFIANWDFVDTANSGEGGTRMPRADWNFLRTTEWSFPDIIEQKTIASILSSLDDKIDLLHRQNKTLEALAETFFRRWFVEEADERISSVKLGDVVQTTSGGTPSRDNPEFFANGIYNWVKSKELQGTFIFDTEELITEKALRNSSAKLVPENSVLIALYGATVGEYAILSKQATCNQAVCALIPNKDYPYTYLFNLVKVNKENLINLAVGSAQQNISQLLIKDLGISSDKMLIQKYHLEVNAIFEKIKSNIIQIRTLTQLRDTLLPKLMSGEIRLNCDLCD
jgi:type I restriction enzyme S subunit